MAYETLDTYDRYLFAIGRLCASWALLDQELTALGGALLGLDKAQAACVANEMKDVAPRCRLIQTLLFAKDFPRDWREDVRDLTNIISNQLAPQRNRYIHDRFGTREERIMKMDSRVKLGKKESFAELELIFNMEDEVDKDDVENVALKAIAASARLAQARFDVESYHREGRFPEPPQLERWRVKQILGLRFLPDD